jgi:hypothetical protein
MEEGWAGRVVSGRVCVCGARGAGARGGGARGRSSSWPATAPGQAAGRGGGDTQARDKVATYRVLSAALAACPAARHCVSGRPQQPT